MIDPVCLCPTDQQETFWSLLRSGPHWLFEIFLIVLIDILILGILWPIVLKHWKHHECPEEENDNKK
jgi:hypothetical protein